MGIWNMEPAHGVVTIQTTHKQLSNALGSLMSSG